MYDIRKAKLRDLDEIVQLWEGLREDQNGYRLSGSEERVNLEFKDDANEIFRSYCRKTIFSPNGVVFISENGGVIVGYLLGVIQKFVPVYKIERMAYISDIYVHPDHRSRGIASKMNEEFEKWLTVKGVEYSSLMVIHSNERAHGLYTDWGYGDALFVMRKRL
jgi:ribosomal protein S18 acetylase RimI-like enzyme